MGMCVFVCLWFRGKFIKIHEKRTVQVDHLKAEVSRSISTMTSRHYCVIGTFRLARVPDQHSMRHVR